MEAKVSRVKRARLLSQNQIRDIVTHSDSEVEKYYASSETENEEEPRPLSRRSVISHRASPDYSASSPEDEDDIGNVSGHQPQPSQWTHPPKPPRHVGHTLIGAPKGKSNEAAHITSESTPLSALRLFFAEIITQL